MLLLDPFLAVLAFGRDKGMGMVFLGVTPREDDCARESIGSGIGAAKGSRLAISLSELVVGQSYFTSGSNLPERVHAGNVGRHDVRSAVRRAESRGKG